MKKVPKSEKFRRMVKEGRREEERTRKRGRERESWETREIEHAREK